MSVSDACDGGSGAKPPADCRRPPPLRPLPATCTCGDCEVPTRWRLRACRTDTDVGGVTSVDADACAWLRVTRAVAGVTGAVDDGAPAAPPFPLLRPTLALARALDPVRAAAAPLALRVGRAAPAAVLLALDRARLLPLSRLPRLLARLAVARVARVARDPRPAWPSVVTNAPPVCEEARLLLCCAARCQSLASVPRCQRSRQCPPRRRSSAHTTRVRAENTAKPSAQRVCAATYTQSLAHHSYSQPPAPASPHAHHGR